MNKQSKPNQVDVNKEDNRLDDILENVYQMGFQVGQYIIPSDGRLEHTLAQSKLAVKELIREQIGDELEKVKKLYAESYERIAKELELNKEVPHTAFHVIIDQRLAELKGRE